jgi:release factor glutamine methyltransferase
MKIIDYQPFEGAKNYYLELDETDQPVNLYYRNQPEDSFQLKIKPNGYTPKSGIFLCQSICPLVKNKSVLEIGTGETGLISVFSSKHGAKNVTAVDIDKDTVGWAKLNGRLNNLNNIDWLVSDIYSQIDKKFDLILSNPPQMPMTINSPHDSGGKDGRDLIDKIITGAPKHLNKKGSIILLVFDFLSVDKQYGENTTIFELLKNNGFVPSIISEIEKTIRPGGKTFESINDIEKYYPKYHFGKDKFGNPCYQIQIVKGDLT